MSYLEIVKRLERQLDAKKGRATKPTITQLQQVTSQGGRASLLLFAGAGLTMEVYSTLLGEPIWFVSGDRELHALLECRVKRGSIYTAQELEHLLNLPGLSGAGVKSLHAAKALFDGTVERRTDRAD